MTPADVIDRLRTAWARQSATHQGKLPRVRIDWEDYFKCFCEKHGRFPLLWANKLLFPDAWTYSATDHAGPEWPPPEDEVERIKLKRIYWKLRLNAVRRDLPETKERVRQLTELLAVRDLTPRQRVTTVDEDTGKVNIELTDIDVGAAAMRLRWLEQDLAVCRLMIVNPDLDMEEVSARVRETDKAKL